jgi:hypothetical protein
MKDQQDISRHSENAAPHEAAKEKARERLAPTAVSRLADYLESPPPYRKHCTKGKLWLVLDAHGDSVLWSDQEIAVDAAVEALNHMAGVGAENAATHAPGAAMNHPARSK